MPYSSAEIAAQNGAYAQHYAMMGIGGGFGPQGMGMAADSMMGSATSRAGGVAGPMMNMGLGMMGMDPISLGMRAGMGSWRMGAGLMGAGSVGMATAGVAGLGLMGASWAGGQMMQGMQNQQGFNQGMRQNFNFINGQGGQGFSRADLGGISSTLQSMTSQYGPGGEVNTFGELSKLAQNMGKMGLTTGVRDAQEFSKRFKEMVSTLKTVATELGTSLESAQELLSSARGSGIFKTADQLKFGATLRTTGLAGGLSTSEMTAMGNIGSQISRSVGGLGRQGAMGGIRALGQIGTATQIGAMSEEDIYNATGLTGAEGRQAMATGMMQNSASFMKSSRGRFFLASIAQKDGKLDMDAVNQYMMGGGMSVNETRNKAHENLRGVGRANFIRNEGRLRGAAMEQFGALAPALALQGWLEGKGIDTETDRGMLAVQRYLGVGRDEADETMKVMRNLPQIMQEQRRVGRDDSFMQAKGQHMKSRDIRTRLDQMKEGVQSKVQKWGADLFTSGSNWLEDIANRVLDNYQTQMNEDVDKVTYHARFGGTGAQKSIKELLGTAESMKTGRAAAEKLGLMSAGGFSAGNNSGMQQYSRATLAAAASAAPGAKPSVISDLDKYKSGMGPEGVGDFFSGQGGYRSIAEANRALGASMLSGRSDKDYMRDAGTGNQFLGMLSMGASAAGRLGKSYLDMFNGTKSEEQGSIFSSAFEDSKKFIRSRSDLANQDQARGDFLRSKEGRQLIGSLNEGDASAGMKRLKELQSGEYSKLTNDEKGQLQALQMTSMGVEYTRLQDDKTLGKDDRAKRVQHLLEQAKASDAIKGTGTGKVTEADLKQWGTTVSAAQYFNQRDNALQYAAKTGKQGVDELAAMTRTGLITRGKGGEMELRATTKKDGLSADGSQAAKLALEITKDQANLVNITDEDAKLRALQGIQDKSIGADGKGGLAAQVGNMSTRDKRAFAKMMSGTQFGDLAMDMAGADTQVRGMMKATGGRSPAAMARIMGLQLGKDAEKDLTAEGLEQKLGMGGNADFDKTLKGALDAMKGGKNNAGQLMQQALSSLSDEARAKIKATNEGEADPLQQKIADNSDKATTHLENIAKKIGAMPEILQKLADSNTSNVEKDTK
jgi:hypothetical protein